MYARSLISTPDHPFSPLATLRFVAPVRHTPTNSASAVTHATSKAPLKVKDSRRPGSSSPNAESTRLMGKTPFTAMINPLCREESGGVRLRRALNHSSEAMGQMTPKPSSRTARKILNGDSVRQRSVEAAAPARLPDPIDHAEEECAISNGTEMTHLLVVDGLDRDPCNAKTVELRA